MPKPSVNMPDGERITKKELIQRVITLNPSLRQFEVRQKIKKEYGVSVGANLVCDAAKSLRNGKKAAPPTPHPLPLSIEPMLPEPQPATDPATRAKAIVTLCEVIEVLGVNSAKQLLDIME